MNHFLLALSLLSLLLLPSYLKAQESIADLSPAHASALEQFLTKNAGLVLASESITDQSTLKDMRKSFGARFKPFYRVGDFNSDGVADFAVVLINRGGPTGNQGAGIAETHRYLYDTTIVIFNGGRGGYTPVFVKTTKAPLVCYLNLTGGKKKRLAFGVYETDEGFTLRPTKNGYVVE